MGKIKVFKWWKRASSSFFDFVTENWRRCVLVGEEYGTNTQKPSAKGSSVLLLQLGFVWTYRKKTRAQKYPVRPHLSLYNLFLALLFCERTRGHCVEWKRRESERERNNTETLVIRLQGLPRCAQPRHTQKKKKKKDRKVFLLRDSIRLYGGTVGVCVCKVLYGLANTWRFWGGKSSCTADNCVGTVQGSKLLLWNTFEIGRHVPPALVLNRAHTEIFIWKEAEESGLCLVGVVIMLRPDRQTSKKKRKTQTLGFYPRPIIISLFYKTLHEKPPVYLFYFTVEMWNFVWLFFKKMQLPSLFLPLETCSSFFLLEGLISVAVSGHRARPIMQVDYLLAI
jgi:hypothetical protein